MGTSGCRHILSLALCGLFCGCAAWSTPRSAPNLTGYQTARLTYRLDAARLGMPLAMSRVDARQVDYQQVETPPMAAESAGMLDIYYPHPDGRPDMALAAVTLHQQRSRPRGLTSLPRHWWRAMRGEKGAEVAEPDWLYESWVLDIPKSELDALIAQLPSDPAQASAAARPGIVVQLTVDGHSAAMPGASTAPLDALMHRVRREGQLVAFRGVARPHAADGGVPPSVLAWRGGNEMVAADSERLTSVAPASLALGITAPTAGVTLPPAATGPAYATTGQPPFSYPSTAETARTVITGVAAAQLPLSGSGAEVAQRPADVIIR